MPISLFWLINKPPYNLTSRHPISQPMKMGAPTPNRIAPSDSQSANLWMNVTNSRGSLNKGGMNQPIERPSKIGNLQKQSYSHSLIGMSL